MKFWTFSGINSPRDPTTGQYTDYVWELLKGKVPGVTPNRRYASRLGTSDAYDKSHNVLRLKSEKLLDREANEFVQNGGDWPVIPGGSLRGLRVKVLLVAPKTTTRPPDDPGLRVEVYWSPRDQVPNQSFIRPDSLTFWRNFERGGGQVWPVENLLGSGLGQGHDFNGFAVDQPKLVTRVLVPRPGSHVKRYLWRTTGENAPSPIAMLKSWLADDRNDLLILAHSQGTNIAMHQLRKGFE